MKSQFKTRKIFTRLGLAVACLLPAVALHAQNGEAKFKAVCASCHSIGEGKRVGPDLKDIATRRKPEWLLNFIKSPQKMIASDADAKALAAEYTLVMPDQNLPDAEINSILEYIAGGGSAVASGSQATPAAPVRSTADATPAEIDLGRRFFMGQEVFSNGGAACISCHNVNYKGVIPGGLLAKDLTTAYSRVGGDPGCMAILGSPAFPAMQQTYADRKLNDKEIYALTAFLNKVNNDTANQTGSPNPLNYGGAAGIVVILAAVFVIWNKRKRSTVKNDIYRRQVRTR